jgi:hypothetical protein
MKLTEWLSIEQDVIADLRARVRSGDNEAARVLLTHLRLTFKRIDAWKAGKEAERDGKAATWQEIRAAKAKEKKDRQAREAGQESTEGTE